MAYPSSWNDYSLLDNLPADDDTFLTYDTSAGMIKRVNGKNVSNKLNGRRCFVQSSQPSDADSEVGDIWIDIS